MDKNLVKAVVDFSILLEFSDSSEINEDAAMKALEQLGYRLQMMSDVAKNELIECIEDVSAEYGDKAEFVLTMPDVFGLR